MSQVYPWDRGTNYAVQLGRRVAKMVMDEPQSRSRGAYSAGRRGGEPTHRTNALQQVSGPPQGRPPPICDGCVSLR